ncbi:MAG: tetratricopeptide repeat protein [Persicimonas sp.]
MRQNPETDEAELAAQEELKRAYMQVSFGQFDQAIESCERAARHLPDHHLPAALKGSFELAAGRVREALGTLRQATRRWNDQPLPWLYFAEACFLGGRRRQGLRALDKAEKHAARMEQGEQVAQIGELIDELRQIWKAVEPTEMPPPLVAQTGGANQR